MTDKNLGGCYNRPSEVLSLFLTLLYVHLNLVLCGVVPLVPRSFRVLRTEKDKQVQAEVPSEREILLLPK